MWRMSNTRRCLSTCRKILGNNTANVKLASVQVEIHYAELWPILITEDLVYYYKDIYDNETLMKHYTPTGRRNHGRPLKRLLDTWDRNGSSCPTPWQIDNDDDDDDDGDDDNICKYTRLNKHKFTSHNLNFPSNICLRQQHCLPYTNKGTYPLQCTSDGVTDVGLIPGRLHAIETSLTWKYKDVQLVIKM